jgi:hypothetical protein
MGIIKDRHGTYYVQKRVPEHLQEAVAHVLDADEPRRVFLKKSLGTQSPKEAKAAAPHVVADFNRIIGQAEALPDRWARCGPQTEDNTDPRVGAVPAVQGLFAGAWLYVQKPLGCPASAEDFGERPAVNLVAGRTVKLSAQSGSPRRRSILDRLSADLWRPRSEHGWRRICFRFRAA